MQCLLRFRLQTTAAGGSLRLAFELDNECHLVNEAPAPVLTRLRRAGDRMSLLARMPARVAIGRRIAAADLPARHAHAEMKPPTSNPQALLAPHNGVRQLDDTDLVDVIAGCRHAGAIRSTNEARRPASRRRRDIVAPRRPTWNSGSIPATHLSECELLSGSRSSAGSPLSPTTHRLTCVPKPRPLRSGDIVCVVLHANVVDRLLLHPAMGVLEHTECGPPGIRPAGVEVLVQRAGRSARAHQGLSGAPRGSSRRLGARPHARGAMHVAQAMMKTGCLRRSMTRDLLRGGKAPVQPQDQSHWPDRGCRFPPSSNATRERGSHD